MRFYTPLLAALTVGLVATSASAQAPDNDVRCMLVANLFAQAEKDVARKQTAAAIGMFYFGRVDARLNGAQLRAQVSTMDKFVKPTEAPTIMNNCARAVQGKQTAFQNLGRSIAAQKGIAPPAK